MSKARVQITVSTEVEVTDGGYLGPSSPLDDHIKAAMAEVARWKLQVVKRNGDDPEPLKATMTVDRVVIEP